MTLLDDHRLIAQARPAFASEGQEPTASIEQLLLRLEDAPHDRSLLDALFRCAHAVKDSAGLFGLDEVVAFTQHVETLLGRLREGRIELTPALSTLLLQCNDQIRQLIDLATGGADDDGGQAHRDALVSQLDAVVEVIENPGSALHSDAAGDSLTELRDQPLPALCLRGVSGSTILGNGDAALNFDVASLGRLAADAADSFPRPTHIVPQESTLS